jgi:hypothetical protein
LLDFGYHQLTRLAKAITRTPRPALPQRHGCSNGGARLLLPNAVLEPSHDCSALKE